MMFGCKLCFTLPNIKGNIWILRTAVGFRKLDSNLSTIKLYLRRLLSLGFRCLRSFYKMAKAQFDSWISVVLTYAAMYALAMAYAMMKLSWVTAKVIWSGPGYVQVKQRSVPPHCLTDSSQGLKHNSVKLKNGIKLHYVECGNNSKPLMLFLHGFPEFWFSWRYQLGEFSKDYWTVAVDMRGFGDSSKPNGSKNYGIDLLVEDISQLIDHLLEKRQGPLAICSVLIGHDLGGIVAWDVARCHPHLVDKLVVISAPQHDLMVRYAKSSIVRFIRAWFSFFLLLPWIPEFILRSNDFSYFSGDRKRQQVNCCSQELEAYKYTYSQPGALTSALNYYRAVPWVERKPVKMADNPELKSSEEYELKLKETEVLIQVPTLIIWGTGDTVTHHTLAELSARKVRNVRVKYVGYGSHFVHLDAPETVNTHIREFIKISGIFRRSSSRGRELMGQMINSVGTHLVDGVVRLTEASVQPIKGKVAQLIIPSSPAATAALVVAVPVVKAMFKTTNNVCIPVAKHLASAMFKSSIYTALSFAGVSQSPLNCTNSTSPYFQLGDGSQDTNTSYFW